MNLKATKVCRALQISEVAEYKTTDFRQRKLRADKLRDVEVQLSGQDVCTEFDYLNNREFCEMSKHLRNAYVSDLVSLDDEYLHFQINYALEK